MKYLVIGVNGMLPTALRTVIRVFRTFAQSPKPNAGVQASFFKWYHAHTDWPHTQKSLVASHSALVSVVYGPCGIGATPAGGAPVTGRFERGAPMNGGPCDRGDLDEGGWGEAAAGGFFLVF